MESFSDDKEMAREPLLERRQKGGFTTMPFILGNGSFEKVASYGLPPNMITYLMNDYHLGMAAGSNILFLWSAATNFMPVIGAFIADSYVGRFWLIGFGSIVSLLGTILLWLTAVTPQARPPHCEASSYTCTSPTILQLILLCSSFGLCSIGAGGIRSSSMAFGADQLEQNNGLKIANALESYLTWYYVSTSLSILLATTCIVYIQDNAGWEVGFGVPALLMFLAALSFFLGSSFYVKLNANSSLLTGLVQVVVAAYRNRHISLKSQRAHILYHSKRGSMVVVPSEKLRLLNKACIVRDPAVELTPEGNASNPWSLCTVDQVEQLKSVIKVIPLWSTGIMISVTVSQNSLAVIQATSMDRYILGFEIPAASFSMFLIISAMLWLVLYDRLILPLASRIMGKPAHLNAKQRMGIGLFFSFLSMAVTAIVESIRRGYAAKEATLRLSALWLVPQYCLGGLAEAFNAVGQNEFYFSELPRSLSSVASNLNGVGMCIANLLASLILSTVDDFTAKGGKESWVSSDINKGHYDYYYLILSTLSLLNVLYFLACSRAYGPALGGGKVAPDGGEGMGDG